MRFTEPMIVLRNYKFRIAGQIRKFLKTFEKHLYEGGIGTVSEIFDGEAPYYPKGCIAQAWGVSEVLRVYLDELN